MSNRRFVCRAVHIACAGSISRVALSDHVTVLVVTCATPAEKDGCLDARPADLHSRRSRVRHMRVSEFPADVQSAFARSVAKHCRIFDINFLVDVKLRLASKQGSRRSRLDEG